MEGSCFPAAGMCTAGLAGGLQVPPLQDRTRAWGSGTEEVPFLLLAPGTRGQSLRCKIKCNIANTAFTCM